MHLPSGLKYREQIQGTGRMPEPGELVKVHYSALIMETDTLYESTYQSQYPFQFCINDGSAIRGINEGVATMKEGGRRLLYVLPHLGYGRFSTPPNITLLIEVELIQIGPDQTWWQKLRSLFS
jgi:peptidylprolyl isomerase